MKKSIGFVLAAAAALFTTSTATADGFGPAGCGLGSLVFEPDSGFTQIFAATTNGTFGSQTFGITTGTSNCDSSGGGSASAAAFVSANRNALAKDIARGQGETVASLRHVAGCTADSSKVAKSLQKNFRKIFPNSRATNKQVSSAVVQTLKSDASLSCSL